MTPTKPPPTTVRDGLDDLARQLSPPLLNAYFHGQLLSAEGLEQEQLYGRYRSALLASMLVPSVGGAVLQGLEVAQQAADKGGAATLTVNPGVAIDGYGRLVVVPDPKAPAGNGNLSGGAMLPLAGYLPQNVTTPQSFDLVLYHALIPVQESPVLAGDSGGGVPEYAASLHRQGYRLDLVPPSPPPATTSYADALFPFEPPAAFAAGRPAKLREGCHQIVPTAGAAGPGAAIVPAPGVTLARVTASSDGATPPGWKVVIDLSLRREVFPLGTLTQLLLDLAGRLDTALRRRTLTILSGNAQTGEPGKALGSDLVVKAPTHKAKPSVGRKWSSTPPAAGARPPPPV